MAAGYPVADYLGFVVVRRVVVGVDAFKGLKVSPK